MKLPNKFTGRLMLWVLVALVLMGQFAPDNAQAQGRVAAPYGDYTVMVGQTLSLSWSTSKVLNSATWRSFSTNNVQIVSSSYFNCTVKGVAPTSSRVLVQCNYYYWVTSGTYSYLMQGTEDFYINVYSPNPTGVSLPSSCSVQVGRNTTLTPVVTPSGAPATFTWSSTNPAVATVSGGVVTGQNVGSAAVTVTTQNGLSASCAVTVTEPPVSVQSSVPANNAVNVDCGATVTATYPSALSQGPSFASIQLAKTADGAAVPGTAAISGSSVVFTPSQRLQNGVAYRLTIPAGAVKNQWGTTCQGVAGINFTTVALEITGTTPASNATGAAVGSPVRIAFNAAVAQSAAYASISLVKQADGSAVAFTPSISGSALVITPGAALEYRTKYRLAVPSGALANANGAVYQKSVTLDFTTELEPDAFSGGDGSAASPYVVATQAQLSLIRSFPNLCYELAGDIALTGVWTPIGTGSEPFTGTLDGNGHSITNVTVDAGQYAGLFGNCTNATFRNLTVCTSADGVKVTADQVLTAYAGVLAACGTMTVEGCHTDGKVIFGYKTSSIYNFIPYTGGLAGSVTGGSITDCDSSADVSVTTNGTYYAGGLAGWSTAAISNCQASGLVSAITAMKSTAMDGYIGGLIGHTRGALTNCAAEGAKGVTAGGSTGFGHRNLYAGGLVGFADAAVNNCRAANTVSVTAAGPTDGGGEIRYLYLGGFAGWINRTVTNSLSVTTVDAAVTDFSQTQLHAGGFTGGTPAGSTISHCYSSGSVSALAKTTGNYQNAVALTGGFIAESGGSVLNSYSTGSVSGKTVVTGTNANQYPTAGGFAGSAKGAVTNCYSAGCPSATKGAAGITAPVYGFAASVSGSLTGCYYDSTVSKCSDTGQGTPKTTAEMSQPATYTGWDFEKVWVMNAARSCYPTFLSDSEIIRVSRIEIVSAATAITTDNGTLRLAARVTPLYATDKTIAWTANNAAVASVDETGLVTAKANGTVTVRATAGDGSGVYGEVSITVSNQVIPVEGITVTGAGGATAISTDRGTLQMTAAVRPAGATNKAVAWSVDNTAVAAISAGGLLSAKADGTVTVRAAAKDGSAVYGEKAIAVSNQKLRTANGLIWVREGDEAVIAGYEGAGGDVTIPPAISGLPVAVIGEGAFEGCQGVTAITLPAGVRQIRANAFNACGGLRAIHVDAASASFSSQDGVLFNKNGTALLRYPAGKAGSAYAIPAGVTAIGDGAFGFCRGLSSIGVADANASFSSVGGVLFSKSGDKLVQYPCGKADAKYVMSSGVRAIAAMAFAGAGSLTQVTVPGGVTLIDTLAFQSCVKLTGVWFSGAPPAFGAYVFGQAAAVPTVYYHISQGAAWAGCNLKKQAYCGMTMYLQDGSAPKTSVALVNGGHVAAPASPTRAGYTFAGWYKQAACTAAWNFASDVITSDIALYARWNLFIPAAPAGVRAVSASYTSVRITWNAVAGATGYEVYRAASATGAYSPVGAATASAFTNAGLTAGKTYYYKVRAYAMIGKTKTVGAGSAAVAAKPVPAAPTWAKATPASYGSIRVTWPAVAGATKYELYRATSKTGTYKLVTTTAALAYTNTGVSTGTAYYYRVRAYRLVGTAKVYGAYSPVCTAKTALSAPASPRAVRASSTSIKLTWAKVAGATKYEVWRAASRAGTYARVTTTGNAYYTNTRLIRGRTYYYKIRAYRLVGTVKVYGGYSAVVYAKP